jgi:hypothetical protein
VDRKRKENGKHVNSLFSPHVIANTSEGIWDFIIESDDECEIAEYVQAYAIVGCKMESKQSGQGEKDSLSG